MQCLHHRVIAQKLQNLFGGLQQAEFLTKVISINMNTIYAVFAPQSIAQTLQKLLSGLQQEKYNLPSNSIHLFVAQLFKVFSPD